jgi:putative aminopeptidase FrvX
MRWDVTMKEEHIMSSVEKRLERLVRWTEALCLIPGLSGYEDPVADYICSEFSGTRAESRIDSAGNLFLTVKGTSEDAPKVMVFAHTDQLGLIVRRIEDNGFLRVERLGGVPEKVLPGINVVIMNDAGQPVPGLICVKAHHATPQNEKYEVVTADKLYLDIGATSADEVKARGIHIGAPVTYRPSFQRLMGSRITGTALDDRAGCAILMDLIRCTLDSPIPATLQAVFTVQEEFNLRGALTAAASLMPDAAISVDIMVASDTPDLGERGELALGKGSSVGLYSFHGRGTLNGTIPHPALLNLIVDQADTHGLPLQRSAHTGLLTDSSYVQLLGEGVPSIDVGYPCRYTHSPVETCDLSDMEELSRLLHHALGAMDDNFSFERRRYPCAAS